MRNKEKLTLIQNFLASDSDKVMVSGNEGISKTGVFGEDYFIGEFDLEGKPLKGTFVLPKEIKLTIEPHPDQEKAEQGFLYARQFNVEQNTVQPMDIKWKEGEALSLDTGNFKAYETQSVLTRVSDPLIEEAKDLKQQQVMEYAQEKYSELSRRHAELFAHEEIPESILRLKKVEPRLSATMLAEFGFRINPETEKFYNQLEQEIDSKRDGRSMFVEGNKQHGNCLEFSGDIGRQAMEQEDLNVFTIGGRPNHVFNIAVTNGKPYLLDSWHGNLACEFNADNFYQHASLHGIYNFNISDKNTYKSEEDPRYNGYLDKENPRVQEEESMVTKQIEAIKNAGFEKKYQQILTQRIEAEILSLNPNDAYYLENAKELQYSIDHFCLDEQLKDMMKEQYIQKCDIDGFPKGHQDNVIRELFCQDTENPQLEFENIKKQISDARQEEEKQSFVEKLGLEKNTKQESFVERMQSVKYGNIGSKGGSHEL